VAIRIFQHYWHLHLAVLAVVEAAIFFFAPYAGVLLGLDAHTQEVGGLFGPLFSRGALFAVVMFVCMAAMGLYNARQRSRLAGLLARVAASVLTGALLIAVVFYLFPQLQIGRGALMLSTALAFGGVVLVRAIWDTLVDEDLFKRRVLVYGAGRRAGSIARLRRRSDRRGFMIVGYLPAAGDAPSEIPETDKVRTRNDLLSLCVEQRVDEIVVAMDDRRQQFPMDELLECRLEGVEIVELVSFLERETGKVRLDILNPSWMIFSEGFRKSKVLLASKRALDIAVAGLGLVLAAPIMLVVMALIKLTSPGPIFYRQERVGQHGRTFMVVKFRSMRVDAEADTGPVWAQKNDSRVTPIGGFLRRSRLDEIPQLWNALRGDMSMVGPRPERPGFVADLTKQIPFYGQRHVVKPGVTGWAQVRYTYGASVEDALQKLQYDLYYIKNMSVYLDIFVMLQTVKTVLLRRGAS
jgi:sugar transferase (PEP-CTERM system associated)